jgi:cobalamin synthase
MVITSGHVSSYGDSTDALAHYYDNAVRGTARQVRIDSVFIRRWISAELITSAETRGTAYRGVLLTAGLPNPAVDALENRHLIRAETRAGARWYELTHDRFLRPIEEANLRAIRWSRLGYWGAAAAVLIICLSFLNFWLYGQLDVLFRVAFALIATAGIVQASWILTRRRLKYWHPFERRSRRTRLAALARKTPAFLFVAFIWLFCLVLASDLLFTDQCFGGTAIMTMYRDAGSSPACLQGTATSVKWGLVISSVVLAAVVTSVGSQLSRRRAVRRWRRMADRPIGADMALEEVGRTTPPDTNPPPGSAEGVGQPPGGGPVTANPR